jgi:hypothetical protein
MEETDKTMTLGFFSPAKTVSMQNHDLHLLTIARKLKEPFGQTYTEFLEQQ